MRDEPRPDDVGNLKPLDDVCLECGQAFTITAGERQFFDRHGLAIPRRCRTCRAARRHAREWAREDD